MGKNKLIIGTRGSELALWQANYVKSLINSLDNNIEVELKLIKTKGDKILDTALSKIGDKGLFTKELEIELLEGNIDLAVHSLKDLQTQIPEGLSLTAVLKRHSTNDVLIAREPNVKIEDLNKNAKVATGSLRRKSQLLNIRRDLIVEELRGNVNTRICKFLESDWEAIILAKAGVERINLQKYISSVISVEQIIPAVGQGALAIETNINNNFVNDFIKSLNDENTYKAVSHERSFLKALGGGCQNPIAAYCEIIGDDINIIGMVGSIDGRQIIRNKFKDKIDNNNNIGQKLANNLIQEGALEIISNNSNI